MTDEAVTTEVDPETGARYTRLRDGNAARTVHVSDLVMVDLNADGQPIGIEDLTVLASGDSPTGPETDG